MWTVETTATVTVAASPVECYRIDPTDDGHMIIHYTVVSGTNVRGGVLRILWDVSARRVEFEDISTEDIGTTTALAFSVSYSRTGVRVDATSSSGTWTVALMVVAKTRTGA